MGLLKAFVLALAAGFGIALERFAQVPSVVAAALVLLLWVVFHHAWRRHTQ